MSLISPISIIYIFLYDYFWLLKLRGSEIGVHVVTKYFQYNVIAVPFIT